jgi:cold shock CspA family protein
VPTVVAERKKAIEMTSGICVGWIENRAFGWIRPSTGGADIFAHRNDLVVALMLAQGQNVEFEIVTCERTGKPRANQVRVV